MASYDRSMATGNRSTAARSTGPRFDGQVAVVTGAASGIGRALSATLVERGATVVLADIDEAAVKATADDLKATGVALDVRDADAFGETIADVVRRHGRIDLLFNNAGVGIWGDVSDLTLAHWDRVIDVNLRGVVHGVAAVYPVMISQGRGHIVNTASLAGLVPGPLLTPYAMTKHAVVGLSTGLRAEAAVHGVRVSVVCPGVIDTPILDKGNPPDLPAVPSPLDGRRMLGRSMGKPYPPESLAEDILAGVARNRAFIVSPGHARAAWRIYRLSPELFMRCLPPLLGRMRRGGSRS
jgi:NAD(P)-dependent dehydrogenase (short-subunit alcohol dehydrogenase family)